MDVYTVHTACRSVQSRKDVALMTIKLLQCVSRNMADRVGQTGHQTAGKVDIYFYNTYYV
jgi:hypothetical protein